jgi:hypothetical protein
MTRENYGQAYQRGYDSTVRFLRKRGVARDLVSDVAQAAWVKGWERLSQLRNETMITTWVNAIAINVYRSIPVLLTLSYRSRKHGSQKGSISKSKLELQRVTRVNVFPVPVATAYGSPQSAASDSAGGVHDGKNSDARVRLDFLAIHGGARRAVPSREMNARQALLGTFWASPQTTKRGD